MSRDGLGAIAFVFLFTAVITVGAKTSGGIPLFITAVISWIIFAFTIYFFRDPKRKISSDKNNILSPADGKIIAIEDECEPLFFKKTVKKISIFLSIFNVHINRIPMDGIVTYFDYQNGKFYPAYHKHASAENEQTIISVENERCVVLFKQIAGILARRIVCHIREGYDVKQGARFGMIKFGSRVDIYLPQQVTVNVKINDRVRAGETIIGIIHG